MNQLCDHRDCTNEAQTNHNLCAFHARQEIARLNRKKPAAPDHAVTIARLTAENERMREALRPFAEYDRVNDTDEDIYVPRADLRRARRALADADTWPGDGRWVACSRETNPEKATDCWLAVDSPDLGRIVIPAYCEHRDDWYTPSPEGDRHIADLWWKPVAWMAKPKERPPAPPRTDDEKGQ